MGINDAGDIVGASNDAEWNWPAARWSTKDPNFVQVLGFPGDWSIVFKVNNNGIAVGGYQNFVFDENGNQEFDENGNPILGPTQAVAVRFH